MNHTDRVAQMPEGFQCDASTRHCPVAAFSCPEKGVYGVQFHPEVRHTVEGTTILRNFVLGVCGCKGDYRAEDMIESMLRDIRAQVGEGKVVAGLSGGVDSSVACALAEKALSKGQLTCVFVDHGLCASTRPRAFFAPTATPWASTSSTWTPPSASSPRFPASPTRRKSARSSASCSCASLRKRRKRPARSSSCRAPSTRTASRAAWAVRPPSRATTTSAACPRILCLRRKTSSSRSNPSSRTKCAPSAKRSASRTAWSGGSRSPARSRRARGGGEITREKLDILRKSDAIYLEELENAGLPKTSGSPSPCSPAQRPSA